MCVYVCGRGEICCLMLLRLVSARSSESKRLYLLHFTFVSVHFVFTFVLVLDIFVYNGWHWEETNVIVVII